MFRTFLLMINHSIIIIIINIITIISDISPSIPVWLCLRRLHDFYLYILAPSSVCLSACLFALCPTPTLKEAERLLDLSSGRSIFKMTLWKRKICTNNYTYLQTYCKLQCAWPPACGSLAQDGHLRNCRPWYWTNWFEDILCQS